jgi:maltose alpha-D-glucosyltransferase/alpha-amylase
MAERKKDRAQLDSDPLWYRDAVIYQVHVRAYSDASGDGIGDFRGLASRLDYVRDLGVTAIWLLPFYPSPLRDDGYDIADYGGVHPDYGSLADFKHFLREAHERGLRVITELVLNHTSDQHPWFQRARRAAPGTPQRDFYVWSDTTERYRDARIIFKDFEASNWSWDALAGAYYWHRFYHHQPDLNYASAEVRKAVFGAMDSWLAMGVDGLRLDAVPYLFERDGTNCENLPETHAALRELRRRVEARFADRMLLAEANQWPEDAVAYFGAGDECHMAFHFPLMPRMFMALRMEDRYPIIDILAQTPPIPETCQWAVFLRNHDELTLEMVTDEERDYMYRFYAHDPRARINLGIRRRLAPLCGNDRRRIELMNGLLFSMPGTPVVYYGDEIGMGDNIYLGDRNGVRTPMQWSADRNAGFSRANSQQLYLPVIIDPDFHHQTINVEAQLANPNSLLWWMRRLISMRRRYKAFGRGSLEFLYPENRKVLVFVRRFDEEILLVVANLSRQAQYVEIDLSAFKGMTPIELGGNTRFPRIGELPYLLTLSAHGFYWMALEPSEEAEARAAEREAPPQAVLAGDWRSLLRREHAGDFERVLGSWLPTRRWFAGKARAVDSLGLEDAVHLPPEAGAASLALVRVSYSSGDPELYLVPLAFVTGQRAQELAQWNPQEVVAVLSTAEGEGLLVGALHERAVCDLLLETIGRRRRLRGSAGEVSGETTRSFKRLRGSEPFEPQLLRAEQSNSSVLYGERLVLKLFRRLDEGVNPDLEVGAFLSERAGFERVPPVAGSLEYRPARGAAMTLGVLQGYVKNEGDAWRYTLDALGRYYERVIPLGPREAAALLPSESALDLARSSVPGEVRERIGLYLEPARLLGLRTAEMHIALASDSEDPAFAPEGFSELYQRSLYQSMRNQTDQALELLGRSLGRVDAAARADAERVLAARERILARFAALRGRRITALRTRVHGDYHLGQVLWTGKDFVIIDFEGEPSLPVSTRRIKRSPLRDVAGMLRSFDYAARTALRRQEEAGAFRAEDRPALEPWARAWERWVCATFLAAYLERAADGGFLPQGREELGVLLEAYLLEKAVYELGYELNSRPDWVQLPLAAILDLVGAPPRGVA